MLFKLWSWFVLVARIVAVAFVVSVPIAIALQDAGHVEFAKSAEKAAWVVGLTFLGIENVGVLITRAIRKHNVNMQRDLESALSQLLVGISKTKTARYEELGASIWVKKRFQPLSFWGKPETVLRRVKRFRPLDEPHQSGLRWTSRMGVVGDCWTHQRRRHKVLWTLSRQYDDDALDALTPEQFAKLSKDAQAGFDFREFSVVTGKYSEVLATPIFSRGKTPKLIGVLSIDRAMPEVGPGEHFSPCLNSQRVREDIQVIVELIATRLSSERQTEGEQ